MAEQEAAQKKKTIVKKRTVDKWKKKSWYTIFSSKEFAAKEIGTTVAEKPENVTGRTISVSVRDLAGQARKQHVNIVFKVAEVKGNKAYANAVGHTISEGYLRKFVRNRNSKIQAISLLELADGQKIRVKTITLAPTRIHKKKEMAIRRIMVEKIKELAALGSTQKIISELVFGNIAQNILNDAKRVSQIKRIEVIKSTVVP